MRLLHKNAAPSEVHCGTLFRRGLTMASGRAQRLDLSHVEPLQHRACRTSPWSFLVTRTQSCSQLCMNEKGIESAHSTICGGTRLHMPTKICDSCQLLTRRRRSRVSRPRPPCAGQQLNYRQVGTAAAKVQSIFRAERNQLWHICCRRLCADRALLQSGLCTRRRNRRVASPCPTKTVFLLGT